MKYPTDMVNGDGLWARIHEGHGLSRHMLWKDLTHNLGPAPCDHVMGVEEVHFRYVPRVKWCASLDGWPCDNEGEWHSHWTSVRTSPECAFTVARWKRLREIAPGTPVEASQQEAK